MRNADAAHVGLPSVPRPPSKPTKGQPFRMNLVLDADLVERMDEHIERMRRDRPGLPMTRSALVRMALLDLLGAKPRK